MQSKLSGSVVWEQTSIAEDRRIEGFEAQQNTTGRFDLAAKQEGDDKCSLQSQSRGTIADTHLDAMQHTI